MAMLAALVLLLPAYLLYVRSQRYQRINRVLKDYATRHGRAVPPLRRAEGSPAPTRAAYPMTPAEAQEIILCTLSYDEPFLMNKALQFALFLTYGIPSIAEILRSTGEFLDVDKAGRRYTDTSLLIVSWIRYPLVGPGSGAPEPNGPLDPRGAIAIARTAVLHAHYKITNDDMLYTLSTFILEPSKWAKAFGWRPHTPLEEQAFHVFFSEVGRRLGISEIPSELQDMMDWAEAYETERMVPAQVCAEVASATTRLLLMSLPRALVPFGEKVVATLLYDRLREAILVPAPSPTLRRIVHAGLRFRAFFVRHCVLPRRHNQPKKVVTEPEDAPAFPPDYIPASVEVEQSDKDGMYAPASHPESFETEPWYVAEPNGLAALGAKLLLLLRVVGEDQAPGPRFKPGGYRLETLGPARREGTELDKVRKLAEEIHGGILEGPYAVGGAPRGRCPFAFAG